MKRLLAAAALLAASIAAAQAVVTGVVVKVDKPAGRIAIRHGEVKAYDMPALTGTYKVQDPAMLDKVQAGDAVQFTLDRLDSVFTITKIDRK